MRIERALTLGAGFDKGDEYLLHTIKNIVKSYQKNCKCRTIHFPTFNCRFIFPIYPFSFLRLVCGSRRRRGKEEEGLRIRLRAPLQPAEGVRVFCLRRLPKWILRLHSSADKFGSFFGNLQPLSFVLGRLFLSHCIILFRERCRRTTRTWEHYIYDRARGKKDPFFSQETSGVAFFSTDDVHRTRNRGNGAQSPCNGR